MGITIHPQMRRIFIDALVAMQKETMTKGGDCQKCNDAKVWEQLEQQQKPNLADFLRAGVCTSHLQITQTQLCSKLWELSVADENFNNTDKEGSITTADVVDADMQIRCANWWQRPAPVRIDAITQEIFDPYMWVTDSIAVYFEEFSS